ncbi:MAG: alkaline phosphatase [Planctomycetota bacterium]|nr:MAG: alkaline phosphatase [Planctomycetota bacterium]
MAALRTPALAFLLVFAALGDRARAQGPATGPPPAKNVILMIADGFGPASRTMARAVAERELALDDILVGTCSTYSADSLVTDSAAAATALACGIKTINGAIGVDPAIQPVATLLEAFESQSRSTGIVTTTQITHATPAAFSAHVRIRTMTRAIGEQQLRQGIEVLFGGGTPFHAPSDGGRPNLRALAIEAGYRIVTDRAAFDELEETPVLAIFSSEHMAFEIDRDPLAQPSLAEMTRKALDLLDGDEAGFFLVVEGGRIDHAGHGNDPAAHVADILAYDDAVAVALEFARADGNTLVVSTADHETGGMTLGRAIDGLAVYAWDPEILRRVRGSLGRMAAEIMASEDWEAALGEWTGITDLTAEERAALALAVAAGDLRGALGRFLNRRAGIGWTTGGHTGVDVELFAFGPGSERFRGTHDNAELGRLLAELQGFDMPALTRALGADEGR